MARPAPDGALPLVRRVLRDGVLREFVHPADGAPAREREPGSGPEIPAEPVPPAPALSPGGRAPRLGQLVGRAVRHADGALPLIVPLLRASCDGGGACCGLYHHVPATLPDRDRARELLSDGWDGPLPLEQVFHPAFDARPDALNVVSVDGSCAFRRPDGACRVHEAGGSQAKPQSCLSYPAHFVACGTEWHVSLRPECACVSRSALSGSRMDADLDAWAGLRATLLRVWSVPRVLVLRGHETVPREDYVAWLRATMAALRTSFDPLRTLGAEVGGLAGEEPGPPPGAPWLDRVARALEGELDELARTFDPASPYRLSIEWGARTARALADGADPEPGWSRGRRSDWARRSASAASLLLHGHGLLEHPELLPAARELERVLWLARASHAVGAPEDHDPRLESTTTWFFLWRNLGWGPPEA